MLLGLFTILFFARQHTIDLGSRQKFVLLETILTLTIIVRNLSSLVVGKETPITPLLLIHFERACTVHLTLSKPKLPIRLSQ